MVELRGISKFFPSNGVTALENANLTLCPGEIHALLGENGSGKSTLMHILSGFFPASSGKIFVDRKERSFSSTANALALGIGMVRQHPGFVKGFKVWEDCILGAEKSGLSAGGAFRSVFFDPALSRKRVMELLERWSFDLPLDGQAESLTVSQRLKTAVLSLLLRNVNWFIFDEPTAVLAAEETKTFYGLLKRLRSEGKGIILITHKLEEALEASDRITIMRQGVTGESRNTGELSLEMLKNLVSGAAKQNNIPKDPLQGRKGAGEYKNTDADVADVERPVLEIKNLKIMAPGHPYIRDLSFKLMPGAILGITGVRDSGLETLEMAITGLLDVTHNNSYKWEGTITLNGVDITGKGVRSFRGAGGAYLGADRLGGSVAPDLSLSESLIIHAFNRLRRGIFLSASAVKSFCNKVMIRAGIERSVSDRAYSFSGGMIQRILLAREFAEEPSLLVLAEAGSSLDEANLAKLGGELREFAGRGSSVLLFSADMDELHMMADEILLLRDGTLTVSGYVDEI